MSPEYQRSLIVNAVRIKYTVMSSLSDFNLIDILGEWERQGKLDEEEWKVLDKIVNEYLNGDR